MTNYGQIIEGAIRAVTAAWLTNGIVSTIREIGDGQCEEFATEVLDRILAEHPEARDVVVLGYTEDWWLRELDDDGNDMDEAVMFEADIPRLRSEGAPVPDDLDDDGLSEIIGQATHVWLRWNGRHFDATAPDGRDHFLLMPFFADQLEGYRQDPQRLAA